MDVLKKRKGLLAFYVSTGFLALLFVGFYFAWTPLRIWYWERRALKESGTKRQRAVEGLLSVGPASRPAVERLMEANNEELQVELILGIEKERCQWCLPVLITAMQDDDILVALLASMVGIHLAGLPPPPPWPSKEPVTRAEMLRRNRQRLLGWWQREGKAKYGRGVE